ncbi:hypothetical protein ACSLBF_02440 [Pseudoalteromonas sp. T1lg65]|uniref:hypothetical protein n=1 Tax=Pseudoalteromonas sp. T1lg65 TaxID=2077101 RepID=UPI003F7A6004
MKTLNLASCKRVLGGTNSTDGVCDNTKQTNPPQDTGEISISLGVSKPTKPK